MAGELKIGNRVVAAGAPCLVVAEVGQAHDGSLGMAHSFIDAVAAAGADAVKFQTHIAAAESTLREPFRVPLSQQDASRYAYWQRMELSEPHWQGLARHAAERGLVFLSSPFSVAAVELLQRVGVPAWKIASGEVGNTVLLDAVARTRLPVLLSTGMSTLAEVDAAVAWARRVAVPYAVLQCTTAYPCVAETVGLNLITQYRVRYGCPVGLSDHSGTIYAGLAAVTLGIEVLEVHVTLSREMYGADVPASVTTAELRQLVEGVRFIERMRANPVHKDVVAAELQPLRELFTPSVVARVDLPEGTVLRPEHLAVKKPGTGIPAAQLSTLIGARLRRSLRTDDALQHGDVEGSS